MYDESGKYLFSSSYDKSWSMWDVSRLSKLYNQKGHQK